MNTDRTNKKEINNEGQGIKHGNEGWGIKTPQKNNQIRTCSTQSFHLAHQEPSVGSNTMWNSEIIRIQPKSRDTPEYISSLPYPRRGDFLIYTVI